MIPKDKNERDVLAGEYVLGVLDVDQTREIELALASDDELRGAVTFWENKLHPLASLALPATPPDETWNAIEARIASRTKPAKSSSASVLPWRWSTGVFAALAAGLLLYIAVIPRTPIAPASPLVAVLHSAQSQNAGWIAVLSQNALRLSEITTEEPPAAHAYELWGISPHAARPVPLGVVPANGQLRLASMPSGVGAGATLAISIEPPGGSPTGLPTGPVIYTGVLRKI